MADLREKILLVDDEPGVLSALETLLADTYPILTAENGTAAWQILQDEDIAVAVVDLALPDLNGLELLRRLRENDLPTELIMVTGYGTIDSAVEAMRIGAYDYLTKPVDGARLQQVIAKAVEKNALTVSNRAMATQLRELTQYEELLGQSEAMREIYKLIEAVAKSDASILITGESGTGKELVARAIHQRSNRKQAPFIAVNCSALPSEILENEFFGHEKGAFTGALAEKPGCFELADHGTLFLDEISEMPYELQAKLLRALEERKFRRLGGRKEIAVDVRVISATNHDARRAVKEKILREDLFYRLAVVEIELPALRERIGDLPLLAHAFLQRYAEKAGKRIMGFTREALEILSRHAWPGNVRELRNVIERAVLLCAGRQVTAADLPKFLFEQDDSTEIRIPIGTTVDEAERRIILRTLAAYNNNKTHTAEILGISLKTLHNKLARYASEEK
ncbi:MAG: sigma-54 dependent transcriptional regulator [candidate division KSB1 bacterium]|nr:sigma-54 dependent transcriptional regulator [candidate division KSB1 bacterium]MDZ7303176.1 sigma-54 dependent transcriptional regulator [candidate division KSB1 bacterium]MDZ7310155.1 sigma-54 dependent transcriptional regulator [candidate division KSB1 bacterium]